MSKFTIEDLRDIAYRGSYDDLERELALQLLASMEQEQVAYIGANMLNGMQDECRQSGRVWINDTGLGNCIPLYAVPRLPQPAVQDKATWRDAPVNSENVDWDAGWNACCSAMLQGGNHTEQHLDMANSPVIPDGWQLVPKEPTEAMNKAGWTAINEYDEINPTYRAMLAAAPQQEVK